MKTENDKKIIDEAKNLKKLINKNIRLFFIFIINNL